MSDPRTLRVYAENAAQYAELTDAHATKDPCLEAFIAAMPADALVLDLGCGPGASAARMAEANLRVVAFDPVPEMIERAARIPGVQARVAGFADLEEHAVYDGIWANFSLLHARREDLPDHLSRICAALKTGGRFHIALKTGSGSGRDDLGRFYTYYEESELAGLLEAAGLEVVDSREGRGRGLSGSVDHWIALAAIRSA